MNKLKLALRKFIFGEKATPETYLESLRDKGAVIGEDVHIYSPNHTFIDESIPFMLRIGNHVHITLGVHILCHDYSWAVIKHLHGKVLGGMGKVEIGDNVFIGVGSVILMNTTIGNNVIIGAGSVVHGCIPDNVVVAGSPAKVICSLDEYHEKRERRQYEEAKQIVQEYKKRYGVLPPRKNCQLTSSSSSRVRNCQIQYSLHVCA